MNNFDYDFKYHSFCLPKGLIEQRYYIHVYYKNMDIKWILEDFSPKEINKISKQILQETKQVSFNTYSKNFICKNKYGWKKIEQILMNHYYMNKKDTLLPDNLIFSSLTNFIKNTDEWT